MTELERALLHIKTRADAWAVREVEKALSQEPTDTWSIKDVADTFKKHGIIGEQQPCDDAISRKAVLDGLKGCICEEWVKTLFATMVKQLPSVTQKAGKCKNCKYFEYDSVAKVDGIPLIVAHEICNKWGNGCKTSEDGYCYLFEPQERSDKE